MSDERFSKLTNIQWLFHYLEVKKHKQKEDKNNADFITEIVKTTIELILDRLDLVAAVAATNPKVGAEILNSKELAKARNQLDDNTFAEEYEKLKSIIPASINAKAKMTFGSPVDRMSREDFKKQYGFREG